MRILSVTTLYPNREQPTFGVFVENRLREVAASEGVSLQVVAPVPWFPSGSPMFGRYGDLARIPAAEQRHGIPVSHPRYGQIPKLGINFAAFLLYRCLLRHVRSRILPSFPFDLIDAHVYYPDGVAAVLLAKALGKPVVITARGTDLNLYPKQYPLVRQMIRRAAREADASITVCSALKDALVELGADADKVHVMRNGVDLARFRLTGREAARRIWRMERPTLLSVGHLIERKGHHVAIGAAALMPEVDLVVAGEGPERGALERLAREAGIAHRVRFLGVVSQDEIASLYGAADLLILASSREGWPNVVLEALACGTQVIATRIWGTPEILTMPEAGRLVGERTAEAFAAAAREMLAAPPERARVRTFAEGFSWDATTRAQLALFRGILGAEARAAA